MAYLSSGCRWICRFRVQVASLGGQSSAGFIATPGVGSFGRRQVVLVKMVSVVVPHVCGFLWGVSAFGVVCLVCVQKVAAIYSGVRR